MKSYTKGDVSEQQLEELVRRHSPQIEEGLAFVDHQKQAAGGRLDVLMVDSGKSLVVAELKVIQDDGMLVQGLDYYDYISSHLESFARQYKAHSIDPAQKARLFLIAPDFSQRLVGRCKWLDLPISLFTYNCLKFEDEEDLLPIFMEREIPTPPEIASVSHIENHLAYITDEKVRAVVSSLLEEIKNWRPGNISLDPIQNSISMKANNRVFAYLSVRRKHYIISTYDADGQWKDYPVKSDDELTTVKAIMKAAMEGRIKYAG